jgi:hypothetical protein
MTQPGAVFLGVAAIVVLAVLWILQVQRERQLRAVQGERIMKSLREALLRENIAGSGSNVGVDKKPLVIPGPCERSARPPHGVELSLVLFSPRH